jgi:exodeoxyribonuclease VIII
MNTTQDDTYMEFNDLARGAALPTPRGLYPGMSREHYDRIPLISNTVLKRWMELGGIPSKFGYWLQTRWEEQPTEALILGQALDTLVLEPDQFSNRFATVPSDAPKRPTSVQRNAKKPSPETLHAIGFWNKFAADNVGKTVLDTSQMGRVAGMKHALSRPGNGTYGIFEGCKKTTIVGEFNQWNAKGEVDLWNTSTSHMLDLKTAQDATPEAFGRAAIRFGYIEQATFYLQLAKSAGFDKTAFTWCVVESEPPHSVAVYTFDTENIPEHNDVYNATLNRMRAAHKALLSQLMEGIYPDVSDWRPLEIPGYVIGAAAKELSF